MSSAPGNAGDREPTSPSNASTSCLKLFQGTCIGFICHFAWSSISFLFGPPNERASPTPLFSPKTSRPCNIKALRGQCLELRTPLGHHQVSLATAPWRPLQDPPHPHSPQTEILAFGKLYCLKIIIESSKKTKQKNKKQPITRVPLRKCLF